MKITKNQLRRIIREDISAISIPATARPKIHSLGSAMSGAVSDEMIWGPQRETDEDLDEDLEDLTEEDDFWADDAAAEKDAFLDSMAEMWHDHFAAGAPFSAVMQVLNSAYQDLEDEYR